MSRWRIVHSQNNEGELIIDDIEDGVGLPNQDLNRLKKQEVYVPYYRTYTNVRSSGQVEVNVDRSRAGYIDLAKTDDVKKSVSGGTIAGLRDDGQVSVIDIQAGDLDAPSITSAKFDVGGGSEAYEVEFDVTDDSSSGEDWTITIGNADISDETVSYTDTSASQDSSTVATGLTNEIQSNPTLDGEVSATVSGSVITVTTDKQATPFTYSSGTTGNGSITSTEIATGRVILEGSNFLSTAPFESEVTVEDTSSGESVTATRSEIENDSGLFTDTTVAVLQTTHGLGSASGDVEDVSITADQQSDSSAVSDV